jgi:DNA-binding NarL/FixJ family response regulator
MAGGTDWSADRIRGLEESLQGVPDLSAQLHRCSRVDELLALAAGRAVSDCRFSRGVILTVGDGRLTAGETGVLGVDASDQLRRAVLARPVPIVPGSPEANVIDRAAHGGRRARSATTSSLADALGLRRYALAPIRPDRTAVALLVLDRSDPPVDELDRALVRAVASTIAGALTNVVLRLRIAELSQELRHVTVSVPALMIEAVAAPVVLPSYWGRDVVFPEVRGFQDVRSSEPGSASDAEGPLNRRELEVMALLIEGRSNRDIAKELVVSPDAVKSRLASIMRKLGASNRVDAVSRYLRTRAPEV